MLDMRPPCIMTHTCALLFSALHLLSALTCTSAGHLKYVVQYVLAALDQHMAVMEPGLRAMANRSALLCSSTSCAQLLTLLTITCFLRPHIMSGMFSLFLILKKSPHIRFKITDPDSHREPEIVQLLEQLLHHRRRGAGVAGVAVALQRYELFLFL